MQYPNCDRTVGCGIPQLIHGRGDIQVRELIPIVECRSHKMRRDWRVMFPSQDIDLSNQRPRCMAPFASRRGGILLKELVAC